jgi:tyrosinase
MKISILAAALAGGAVAAPLESRSDNKSDDLMAFGLQNLNTYYSKNSYPNTKCTLKNAAVRKEW